MPKSYIGRFAPSPTGPLHEGSIVAALASWLDARAHAGQWLVRIEDVDTPRCLAGMDDIILRQLADLGLRSDQPVLYQSQRNSYYQAALQDLRDKKLLYPCNCSRSDIAVALAAQGKTHERGTQPIYPGSCRTELAQNHNLNPAWRLRTQGEIERSVGDFVLLRADGCWTYQLAVVVDDAAQGITHVVRGQDLADNTPRQVYLQQCLGLPLLRYRHVALVMGEDGQKLSKQNGAQKADTSQALNCLNAAAQVLGLRALSPSTSLADALAQWVTQWQDLHKDTTYEHFQSNSDT